MITSAQSREQAGCGGGGYHKEERSTRDSSKEKDRILDDCITQPEVSDEMVATEDYPSCHDEYGGFVQNYQEADMIYQEEEVEMMNTTTGISEPRLIVTNVEF